MSKDGSNKRPVPLNMAERFMGMVHVMADMCGIEDIPEVHHYVELLGESVARHIFEKYHKVSPQRKVHNDRKRFIVIFKTRYEQLLDLEYGKTISPIESKLINQANRALKDAGFTCDDYLAWAFEDFLVENPKFRPPTIKASCCQFWLHSFIDASQELRDARRRQELDKKSGMDLISRARAILRDEITGEDEKTVKETLRKYGDRCIMLPELRKVVEGFEAKYREKKRE